MELTFNPNNYSITIIADERKFYAELSDFPRNLAPLVLDEITLYTATDWYLWVQQDRKRINIGEPGGKTFEPKAGDYEIVGNHSYVMSELIEWISIT